MRKLLPAFYYYNHFKCHLNGREEHLSLMGLEFAATGRSFPGTFIVVVLKKDFKVFFLFVAIHKDSVAFEVFLYLFICFGCCFSKSSEISSLHLLRWSHLFLFRLIVCQPLLRSLLVFHRHCSNSNSCPF